jgi:hypothetical protein
MAMNARGYTIPLSERRDPQNNRPVLLLGDCSRTPLTEAEAMEELRKSPEVGTWCAARCLMCFSEDGEAFWHVSQIVYESFYSVRVERACSLCAGCLPPGEQCQACGRISKNGKDS